MNEHRLTMLAELMEAAAQNPDELNRPYTHLAGWMGTIGGGEPDLTCNTEACAIGTACLTPAFQAQGLSYGRGKVHREYEPRYDGKCGWDAVEAFFEIPSNAATFLFSPKHYAHAEWACAPAERAVASRIRGYIAGTERPPL